MRQLSVMLMLCAGLVSQSAGLLSAQSIVSADQAQRAGMVVNWFAQARGVGGSGLVNTALVVDEDQGTTFFELQGGRLREVISEKGIGPDGQPFKDLAAAEEYAKIRQEVMQKHLEFEGSSEQVSINKYTLPKSSIYCMSNSGVVQAFDAESGRLLWQTEIGTSSFPSSGVGASKKLVAAVNGSSVYCLDPANGKLLWQKRCEKAVMGAPSATEDSVFVPLADGRMQIFDATTNGNRTQTMISKGTAFNPPTVSGKVVSWATEGGFLSVAPAKIAGPWSGHLRSANIAVPRPTRLAIMCSWSRKKTTCSNSTRATASRLRAGKSTSTESKRSSEPVATASMFKPQLT